MERVGSSGLYRRGLACAAPVHGVWHIEDQSARFDVRERATGGKNICRSHGLKGATWLAKSIEEQEVTVQRKVAGKGKSAASVYGSDSQPAPGKKTATEKRYGAAGGTNSTVSRPSVDAEVRDRSVNAASPRPIQAKDGSLEASDVHSVAAEGFTGPQSQLPYLDRLQASFGHHDVSDVRVHTGAAAAEATNALNAKAYASGNDVALGPSADLHTVAHEAAHVVQQRAGVHLAGGVGTAGDAYEQHADAVADAVVAGRSAEPLLDQVSPSPRKPRASGGVQRKAASGDPAEARRRLRELWDSRWSEAHRAESFTGNGTAIKRVVVRASPKKKADKLEVLEPGTSVPVVGRKGQWWKVAVNGQDGYVKRGRRFAFAVDESAASPLDVDRSFEAGGSEIAEVRRLIAILPEAERAEHYRKLHDLTPYHSQRDNEPLRPLRTKTKEDWADDMCNVTSLAMAFEYLGLRNPGSLRQDEFFSYEALRPKQKERADRIGMTTPCPQLEDYLDALVYVHGWGNITKLLVWKQLAAHFGVTWAKVFGGGQMPDKQTWLGYRSRYLDAGMAVTLNVGGHIVSLQGVDEELGLIIDDPYGHTKLVTKPKKKVKKDGTVKESWGNNWDLTNNRTAQIVGRNSVCPWSDVERHQFLRADAWGGGAIQKGKK